MAMSAMAASTGTGAVSAAGVSADASAGVSTTAAAVSVAVAAHAVAGDPVERAVDLLVGRDRSAAAGGEPLDRIDALHLRAVVLERVELHREHAWRGLEQQRKVDVIGAKAHAVFAQGRTRR